MYSVQPGLRALRPRWMVRHGRLRVPGLLLEPDCETKRRLPVEGASHMCLTAAPAQSRLSTTDPARAVEPLSLAKARTRAARVPSRRSRRRNLTNPRRRPCSACTREKTARLRADGGSPAYAGHGRRS